MTHSVGSLSVVSLVSGEGDAACLELLHASLREFGGALSRAHMLVFHPPQADFGLDALEGVTALALEPSGPAGGFPFEDKVRACSIAEDVALEDGAGTLAWISPQCLVTAPPEALMLGAGGSAAAFRPVHVKNVGLPADQPPDGFWAGIYGAAGWPGEGRTVESFVDRRVLHPYFNTHVFSVDPSAGLLGRWAGLFAGLASDRDFTSTWCPDGQHSVFLHQAVLSAVAASAGAPGIRLLPPAYSYPLHLHGMIPPSRRIESLGRMVCPVYEGVFDYPVTLSGVTAEPRYLRILLASGIRSGGRGLGRPAPSGPVRG